MGDIHIEELREKHSYTKSKSPWIISRSSSIYGRLIHYISGGGMRIFGRTVQQEEVRRHQVRFYIYAAALTLLWLFFYIY